MGSAFTASTIFRAVDQFSSVVNKMSSTNRTFAQKTNIGLRAVNNAFDATIGRVVNVQNAMFAGALATGYLTKEFIEYDSAITSASARFSDLELNTIKGQRQFEKLKKVARETGAETKFTATQVAEAMEKQAQAGFTTSQSMATLRGTTNLAIAAKVGMAEATGHAADALGAFNLMTEDSAQLTKNLARVNDVFARSSNMAKVELVEMIETGSVAGQSFTLAGQGLETFGAAAVALAKKSLRGSAAGTQLRAMIAKLADPSDKAQKLLSKLGVRVQDNKGNFRDLFDITDDLAKATSKLGTRQKSAAMSIIFGRRAANAMNILLSTGSEKLRAYRENLEKADGAAKKIADTMRNSASHKILALTSALTDLGFKFIDTFVKDGKGGIDSMTASIRAFDEKPYVQGFRRMIDVGLKYGHWLKDIVGLYAAVKAAALASAVMATTAWTAAFGPVAALVVGLNVLVRTSDKFRKKVDWILDKLNRMSKLTNFMTGRGYKTTLDLEKERIAAGGAHLTEYAKEQLRLNPELARANRFENTIKNSLEIGVRAEPGTQATVRSSSLPNPIRTTRTNANSFDKAA